MEIGDSGSQNSYRVVVSHKEEYIYKLYIIKYYSSYKTFHNFTTQLQTLCWFMICDKKKKIDFVEN